MSSGPGLEGVVDMAKRPMNVSPLLRQAVADMGGQANPALVGLVVRFNEDDNTIRDLWSEGSNAVKHRHNPHHTDRAQVTRNVNDANVGLGPRLANKVSDVAGYHAEELLIVSWAALLRGAGLAEHQVRSVDLVLSKSPCHGAGGSSKMRVNGIVGEFGIGCATKLGQFIGLRNTNIEWRIAFLALAGSDAPNYNPIGGHGVDRLMNSRDRQLATAAAQQVHHRHVVVPQSQFQVAQHRLAAQTAQNQIAGAIGAAKGVHSNQAKASNRAATVLDQQTQQRSALLFNQARTQSIGQAQHGIALLDQRSNIDVRRWVG